MNYYQHHIGDFNNATRYLTLVERALYRDLIEMYYDTEQPIDASDFNRLARRLMCRSEEEQVALQFILDEFFQLVDGLYVQSRCERELEEYRSKREQQSRAGKASASKRAHQKNVKNSTAKSVACTTTATQNNTSISSVQQAFNEPATNQEPRTNNQQPITTKLNIHAAHNTSLDEILQLWQPSLQEINSWLARSGLNAYSQQQFEQLKPEFLGYYAQQIQTGLIQPHQLFAKLVAWVKRDYSSPKKAALSHSVKQQNPRSVNEAWGAVPDWQRVSDDQSAIPEDFV